MNFRKRAITASGGVSSKFAFGQFSYGVTHNVSDAMVENRSAQVTAEV